MADQVNVDSFLFNFQAEHVFADSLFKEGTPVGDFLQEMGYKKNALGNLMAEFSDSETVAKIQQLADGDPLKAALMDSNSGTGTVQHNSKASGCGQAGKNAFLTRQINSIRTSSASFEAKLVALDNLFDWTRRLVYEAASDRDPPTIWCCT